MLGAHCLVATAGGALLLGRRASRPIELVGLLWIAAWLAALGAAELLLFGALNLSLFGFIHLAYLDVLLVLPTLAALGFVLARRRARGMTLPARLASGLVLLGVPVLVYATFIEPFDLRLERTDVPLAPARTGPRPLRPLRIGVLSDLQARRVSDYERRAVAELLATSPDIILVPGDVIHQTSFDDYDAALPEFHKLLAQLEAPGGVYFVQGNTDPSSRLEDLVRGTHMRLLRDEIVRFELDGRRIAIGGLDLDHHVVPAGRAVIAELERPGDPTELRLLLAHRPDALWSLSPDSRIDLVVSGHTHGGQIQLPFFGPPITLSSVPRHVAAGGLHTVDGRRIYVSRGVGLERGTAPRIRFLAPPEISLLTLRGSAD